MFYLTLLIVHSCTIVVDSTQIHGLGTRIDHQKAVEIKLSLRQITFVLLSKAVRISVVAFPSPCLLNGVLLRILVSQSKPLLFVCPVGVFLS